MLATNIGFGISYSLPIIVTGLVAKKDSLFIVENPEAHLHPKGQSNIGYFLGKVAEAGVKIIIETHSEHVVNGLRRAILESSSLKATDANIYFFNGFDSNQDPKIELIGIDDDGSLSKFPKDFFDQVNQDLSEIIKLRNKKLNG
jgi:predicted ATPase